MVDLRSGQFRDLLIISQLYSTRQKYSAPSMRRRRRAQVNNIDFKFCEHIH